jgi:hypothetical protein
LWLLQALNEKYEANVAFRINVIGLPDEVELDRDDYFFTARLSDHGNVLAIYELRGAMAVDVEYDNFMYSNGRLVLPLSTVRHKVENLLDASTSLVRLLQDTIVIDVKRSMAVLPVKIDGVIDAADHYTIADIEIVPSVVNVFATQVGLDNVHDVKTEYVVKKYLKSSTSFKVSLAKENLMTMEPSDVDVHVVVQPLVKKKMRVPVNYVGFPHNYSGVLPHDVEVAFDVPEPYADEVEPKDFQVSLAYSQAVAENSRKAEFNVLPSFHKVENVVITPSYINLW